MASDRMKTSNNRKFRNRRFCMLDPNIIESRAFEDLKGKWSLVALIRFHQKAHRKKPKGRGKKAFHQYEITNNGEIVFTYAEAKELGIRSSQTFSKVLKELVEEKGFIDVVEPGAWYSREPTKFSISERWKRYGTPDYKRVELPRRLPDSAGFQKKNKSRFDGAKRDTLMEQTERRISQKETLYYVKPKILPLKLDKILESCGNP